MRIARCHLKSTSKYGYGKPVNEVKPRDETHADFEERVWKQKCHATEDGHLFIPPMAFKSSLAEAAKYKSIQIPGKGKSTFTKHFEAGTQVMDPLVLPETLDTVSHEWLFVPSDGRPGSGSRVWKCFPLVHQWEGNVDYYVFDDIITPEVFEEHLRDSGRFIGIGRFRPRNRGYYGRFEVLGIEWSKV